MKKKVAIEEVQLALAKAHVLADKLGRPDLADEAQNEDYCLMYNSRFSPKQPICPRAIRYVYENTSGSSLMRRAMVNLAVTEYFSKPCFTVEWTKKMSESATSHPQFHVDIMIGLKKRMSKEDDDEINCKSLSCIVHRS